MDATKFGFALAAALLAIGGARADEPVRIVVEAEDMRGVAQDRFGPGPGWQVGRWGKDLYQNMTFGGVWASRLRAAMADAGDAPAEAYRDIDVPAAGRYKLWAKYEAPPFFNYAFALRLQPLGADGVPGAAVFARTYGLRDSLRHFSFNDKLLRGDLYWTWGLDHDAAEGYEVALPKGRYRLTLAKAPSPPPTGARSVDAFLLTSDLADLSSPRYPNYPLLDELRRANHVYFRFRNLDRRPGRIVWNHNGHRPPDYYQAVYRDLVRTYDAAGRPTAASDTIAPGAASLWHDLGPTLNVETSSAFRVRLDPVAGAEKRSLHVAVDIALSPDPKRILRTFTLSPDEPDLAFVVQPDLNRADGVAHTRKTADIYREIIRALDAQPRLGPIPKRLRFFGVTDGPRSSTEDLDITQGFRRALGLNTLTSNLFDPAAVATIRGWWDSHGGGLVARSLSWQHSTDVPAVVAAVRKAGLADAFYSLSFGDEIGLPAVDLKDAATLAAFRALVRDAGETPQSVGAADWDDVRPVPAGDPSVGGRKRLAWYTQRFLTRRATDDFAARTRALQAALGPDVHATANLGGMHPFYWMSQASFIDGVRGGALSLAWSEDYTYCQPEASRLIADFDAAYLRKGASYRASPMLFYAMPHFPGNTPEGLLTNVALQWANGVKDIDWFSPGPDVWATENYIAWRGGLPMWSMVRAISGIAGRIEDDLAPAVVAPASVAVLLSASSDFWEVGGGSQNDIAPGSRATNVSQEERKALWYALRNAGYRVDFVTEDDAAEGRLGGYRAIYLCGENLDRAAAEGLRQWVEAGGSLFATAGAARRDPFDEPLTVLDAALGRGAVRVETRYKGPLRARLELLFAPTLDHLEPGFDALCRTERFAAAAGSQVRATFRRDGAPAWVSVRYGRGTGHYVATLPGQAYLKTALPVRPQGKGGPPAEEPIAFDPEAARTILTPLREAGIAPDVVADRRGIVAGRLESSRSVVVPLVHVTEGRDGLQKAVRVTVNGVARRPARVWSAFHPRGLPFVHADGAVTVTLPTLKTADVLILSSEGAP